MKNHLNKKTKIVATLGPASSSKEVLRGMILAGCNVFRLNFSHGKYEEYDNLITIIRELNVELKSKTAIMADLQGPKLRIGEIEKGGVSIKVGQKIILTTKPCIGNAERAYITYPSFPMDVHKGEEVLLDDGKIKMVVLETNRVDEVVLEVVYGDSLKSKKGVNLPNTDVSLPSLTEKDLRDLDFILDKDVDWIALSFVRKASDIHELRERIVAKNKSSLIIAKIEKPQAITNLDAIIDATDAVMVARGDLGVEYPIEKLPLIQKKIISKCLEKSKPVIIATQMMESMIDNFMPTRAETTDVANGVLDGADALMLSGETSVGKHPVSVIEYMSKIISSIENEADIYYRNRDFVKTSDNFLADSVCYSAVKTAERVFAQAIVSMTKSGYTAFKIASFRPKATIMMFTNELALLTKMNLIWGVNCFYYDKFNSTDEAIEEISNFLKENKYVVKGDVIVNTTSMPVHFMERTNMMKITVID